MEERVHSMAPFVSTGITYIQYTCVCVFVYTPSFPPPVLRSLLSVSLASCNAVDKREGSQRTWEEGGREERSENNGVLTSVSVRDHR